MMRLATEEAPRRREVVTSPEGQKTTKQQGDQAQGVAMCDRQRGGPCDSEDPELELGFHFAFEA